MERSLRPTGLSMLYDRDRPRAFALLVTLLAMGAFLLTGFDFHCHSQLRVPIGGDLPVFSGAAHPEQAPHAEAAGQVTTLCCLACLLQTHSQADTARRSFSAALSEPAGLTRTATPRVLRTPEVDSGGSRAPPAV